MKKTCLTTKNGQTMVEYTIVIGLIVVVLFAMSPMIKRSSQSMIKLVADQIGNQENAEVFVNLEDKKDSGQMLKSSYITTRSTGDKTTEELSGQTIYSYNDVTEITSNALIDLGFTERQGN
ncbi:MAG: hypothetical protein KC618_00060 [Candidatus Omnitrophica bacterium]|nr:hypothetical protein [Candidatus Omnitrophota bacterium]